MAIELPGGRIRLIITVIYTILYGATVYLLVAHVDDLTQTQAALGGSLVGAMASPLKDCYAFWFSIPDNGNAHRPPQTPQERRGRAEATDDIDALNNELRGS